MKELRQGQKFSWTRSISEDDVRRFAEVSGDNGIHHREKDARGRLMAHGLLTATLPTKLGGDVDYMARTMNFEFTLPVYAGDALECVGVVDSVIKQSTRLKVKFSFTVTNQRAEVVLKGTTAGQILLR
jgi:3-hydroxybutyryl-CoA dehydratase